MGNMSYCRFENTSNDLNDCEEHIGEIEEMSDYEFNGMISLLNTCKRIAERYDEEDIKEFEKEWEELKKQEEED